MDSHNETESATASERIDQILADLKDWRGETLARVRQLIRTAIPEVIEEVKWVKPSNPNGVPVWSHHGILCTGEVYKEKVKLTFANGAQVKDPTNIFNSSLEGNARRALDLHEGDPLDDEAFMALICDAARVNAAKVKTKRKPA